MKNANLVSRCSLRLVLALAAASGVAGLSGCGEKKAAAPKAAEQPATFKTVKDFFPIKVGDQVVRMQLAVLQAEQMRGLMARRDLGENEGMIFVSAKPEKKSFYMKNTPTPLDIGYFTADGVLREIYAMYPLDETPVPSRSTAIQFALEMNQGWYKRHTIRPGAQLDMKALAAALKARGFELKAFGLGAE